VIVDGVPRFKVWRFRDRHFALPYLHLRGIVIVMSRAPGHFLCQKRKDQGWQKKNR
jgi:hypothetical protein